MPTQTTHSVSERQSSPRRWLEVEERQRAKAFWDRFGALEARLDPLDARYMHFQLWQEGIARYVELRVTEEAARSTAVCKVFRELEADGPSFEAIAELKREELQSILRAPAASRGRELFYALGAGMGLLLDRDGPRGWKDGYLDETSIVPSRE